MKKLTLCSSSLAIVGAIVSLSLPATAIEAVFSGKTTENIELLPFGFTNLVLKQFNLPAGRWVINYSASAVNFGASDYVRCGVRANGSFISLHTGVAGSVPRYDGVNGSTVSTISGVTTTNFNYPVTIDLACSYDGFGDTPYIDAGAEIVAY